VSSFTVSTVDGKMDTSSNGLPTASKVVDAGNGIWTYPLPILCLFLFEKTVASRWNVSHLPSLQYLLSHTFIH